LNNKKDESIEIGDLVKPRKKLLLHGLGVVIGYHEESTFLKSYEVFWAKRNTSTRASFDELLVVARKRRNTTV
jgi:hypothetical protein